MGRKKLWTLYDAKCLMAKIDPSYDLYCGQITAKEMKILKLQEDRHVPTYQFKDIMWDIVNNIKKQILENGLPYTEEWTNPRGTKVIYKTFNYEVEVPKDIIRRLAPLDGIRIVAHIKRFFLENERDAADDSLITILKKTALNGTSHLSKAEIANGSLNNAIIDVDGFMVNDWLYNENILNVLHHELTHAYDEYISQRKFSQDNHLHNYLTCTGYERVQELCSSDDPMTKIFANMLYRFFYDTEMNALLSQLYSEMAQFEPNKISIWDNLRRTKTWRRYEQSRDALNKLKSFNDWGKWNEWKNYIGLQGLTPQEYKDEVIDLIEYNLKRFVRRMGGTATLWLDENSEYKTVIIS